MGKIFRRFPVPFWCYFFPMLAGTVGLIPRSHPLYESISRQFLPVCLILMLIGTDLQAVARMGKLALGLMLAGSAGTVLGGIVSYSLYRPWLPEETWGGIGALTASWTGGSANMIAVKEALNLPDSLIGPLIIVDAGVAYSWMALLVWSSSQQEKWNCWIAKPAGRTRDRRTLAGPTVAGCAQASDFALPLDRKTNKEGRPAGTVAARPPMPACPAPPPPNWHKLTLAVGLAILFSLAAQWVAQRLPVMGAAFSASTWTVLLVTTTALGLSLTPARRLEEAGASRAGTVLLYVLLISIGARADLRSILHTPVFLALGATWILVHGLVLLTAGWLLQAPLGLIAAASQANIGGTVSAPIVGATFSPRLASLGLLMAIFGNLTGTYIGLATAFLIRKWAQGA